jgi:hypothetical protein
MTTINRTIDELEARLRYLDSQNEYLASIIDTWPAITTPPTRSRQTTRSGTIGSRVRSLPPSPPLFRVMRTQSRQEEDDRLFSYSSESEEEEEDPFFVPNDSYGYWDSWHRDTPEGSPRRPFATPSLAIPSWAEEDECDSDDETVVYPWEDPTITPE